MEPTTLLWNQLHPSGNNYTPLEPTTLLGNTPMEQTTPLWNQLHSWNQLPPLEPTTPLWNQLPPLEPTTPLCNKLHPSGTYYTHLEPTTLPWNQLHHSRNNYTPLEPTTPLWNQLHSWSQPHHAAACPAVACWHIKTNDLAHISLINSSRQHADEYAMTQDDHSVL